MYSWFSNKTNYSFKSKFSFSLYLKIEVVVTIYETLL